VCTKLSKMTHIEYYITAVTPTYKTYMIVQGFYNRLIVAQAMYTV